MNIYEIKIQVRDGESEYIQETRIAAPSQKEANKYAKDLLKNYFGSGTKIREGIAWEEFDMRAAELLSVDPMITLICHGTDGKVYSFNLKENNETNNTK